VQEIRHADDCAMVGKANLRGIAPLISTLNNERFLVIYWFYIHYIRGTAYSISRRLQVI
jgi:hypothetical protein